MGNSIHHPQPPKGHELELRTISALISIGNPNHMRVQAAMLKLDLECFTNAHHKALFSLIQELVTKSHPFDLVELMPVVADSEYHLLTEVLKDEYCSTHQLEHDIEKLLSYRLWRKQLRILVDTVNLSMEQTLPEEALTSISNNLQSLSASVVNGSKSYKRTTEEILDEIFTDGIIASKDFLVNIPDLPPVPNESMITISGRSGHGKTFFALYLMDKIIEQFPDKQAIYFNLEMRDHILLERLSILNGFRGSDQMDTLKRGASNLIAKNLTLVTKASMTIEEIETESRISSLQQPLSVIVVDYLGLISTSVKHETNYLQQSAIAKRLGSLATDLKCVVLCLIQVNRDIKNRPIPDRCPIPTDSAESMGSVDSCSWYLGINQPQNDAPNDDQWQHMFQIQCRKTRTESGMFKVQLKFKGGTFSKWQRPFAPARQVEPQGF